MAKVSLKAKAPTELMEISDGGRFSHAVVLNGHSVMALFSHKHYAEQYVAAVEDKHLPDLYTIREVAE
ncbi:MAG: hypothetical protein P4L79_10115 [Legionella sp.]|uniref:hypothetical protein n=1 Tax=Legionella sp. TaxID=459 RepID=UPI00283ADE5B|nr:hypothetical protein [Legionella sp.]